MTKLNQIIAVAKGVRSHAERELTDSYHRLQKAEPLSGISRKYEPKDAEGQKFPPENKRVQVTVDDELRKVRDSVTRLLDVCATRDYANCDAKADVVVDGDTILYQAPVTFLLFLEKRLVDLRTLMGKLPTLDPAEHWTQNDPAAGPGVWVTDTFQSHRTVKVPRNHVLAPATDKHPAQVSVYNEDVVVGTWHTRKFSGAAEPARVKEITEKIDKLIKAVRFAREEANGIEVSDEPVGKLVFDYLGIG